MGEKGQAAVEYLIILSVAMLFLVSLISMTSNENLAVLQAGDETQARLSIGKIALAVRDVYGQGTGSRKVVDYALPPSYDAAMSRIQNDTIILRVGGTDIAYNTGVQLRGSLPANSGGGQLSVANSGNHVTVGNQSVSLSSPQASFFMELGGNDTVEIAATNDNALTANVSIAMPQLLPDVNFSTFPQSILLGQGQEGTFAITAFSIGDDAGTFFGNAVVTANYSSFLGTVNLPVLAEVTIKNTLALLPTVTNISVTAGQGNSSQVTVCAATGRAQSNITFAVLGDSAGWLSGLTPQTMSSGECRNLTVAVSVPEGTDAGLYQATILASDGTDSDGALYNVFANPGYSDWITLGQIGQAPSKPAWNRNVTAMVAVTTPPTTAVQWCNSTMGMTVKPMSAQDGAFNGNTETAIVNYSNLSPGPHIINVTCANLAGRAASRTGILYMYGSMVMMQETDFASSTEQMWRDWITGHSSEMGQDWRLDTVTRPDVMSGAENLSYYKTLLIAEYDVGAGIPVAIGAFNSSNRSVLLLSAAVESAPWELGLAQGNNTNMGGQKIYVANNTHYITAQQGIGPVKVIDGNDVHYSNETLAANKLADAMSGSTRLANKSALWQAGRVFGWGIDDFSDWDHLTPASEELNTRLLDYALNISSTA